MINIKSYGDFYSMTKRQIIDYLCNKGFACLASHKLCKSDLLFNAIDIYKKYGAYQDVFEYVDANKIDDDIEV